jgi:hypothetical protein
VALGKCSRHQKNLDFNTSIRDFMIDHAPFSSLYELQRCNLSVPSNVVVTARRAQRVDFACTIRQLSNLSTPSLYFNYMLSTA